ncbi:putative ankyrin-3 [Rosellinia necatrix]|uniref:Putative ankyrin-3 n=1 Tax=Rosellinia necatrix TaxID=77044 RepID=A0A1S8A942_ROSNE|nr:putative ankyrin-3 [Rosellinia necatrix]
MSVPGDENVQIIYGYDEPMATTLSGQQVTDVIINKVEHAVEAKRKVKFRSQYHNFLERLGGYAITGSPPLSTCNRSLVPDLMDWIKVTETFASWVDASGSSVLHIMGQPGSGTTILSEHTIGFLRSNSNPDLVMASFTVAVVASASGLSQTTEMLVALSRQLLLLRPDAFQNCSLLCSWIMRIPRTIITETIAWSLLRCIVCAIRDPICFLIRHMDHLGQTPGWEHELVKLSRIGRPSQTLQIVVTTISSLNPTTPKNYNAVTQQDSGVEWVNACRRCTDYGNSGLGQSFSDASYFSLSLNGHQALLSYIEKGVRERVRRWTQGVVWSSLEEEVVSRICVPETTYLLAKQQVDHLRSSVSHTSESELRRCLNMLPSTHDALYRRTLESLSKSKRDWAMAALAWIFLSFRRLDSGELALALAFEHGDIQDLEPIRQNVSYDIIGDLTKMIGPFFKTVGDQFHPIHKAIGFITSLSGYGPKFHANATLTCLKYLSIILRRCNIIGTGGKLLDELDKNLDCGFLHYCVIYWPDHCRSALSSHDNRDIVIRTQNLLETPPLLSIWSQLYGLLTESLVREQEEPVAPLSSVLNVACRFGLLPLAKEYALGHNGSRLVGEIWENALNLASQFGHADIVSWLLQNGTTSVDSISLAGAGGYAGIVDELLANGSDLSLKDGAGYTALLRAAEHGHTNTVSRLLNSLDRQLVNETTPDGSSALHMAARIGHLEGVQKLIGNGASVMQENQAGYIPLHLAAAGGYSDIILALTPGPVMLTRKTSLEDETHTPLHLAAVSGNTEACRQLLRLGSVTLLTIPNEKGWTALHAAAHGGHLDIIRLFLDTLDAASVENQENSNANAEESKDILATVPDESPATLAAANGHVAVMMELLNYKAKERQNSGSTIKTNQIEDLDEAACCLRSAVQSGQVRAVQQLLQIGVNASSSDSAGNTALQLAAQGNDLAVVETLLNKASLKAEDKNASLVLAVLSGNISIARKLMDDGAEVSISDSSHVPSRSPLHAAAKIGNVAMLSELVKTATGQRLFFLVIDDLVSRAAAHGHKNFIQALFTLNRRMREETPRLKNSGKHGHELSGRDCDVISRNTYEGSDKRDDQHFFEKLLITFQAWGDARAVEALLQAGFPCDFENVDETPLHIAAKYGHDTIIGFLIARGAEVQRKTGVGDTALIIAVKKGHVSTCNCLLDLGADVNGTGAEEATALIVACRAGSRDLAGLLLEHHADISAKNILGMTPLHAAVRTPDLVRFLLGRDPKPATNVPNREGRTPLLEAIAEGSLESTDLLMADGVQLGHENRTCLHQAILSRHSAIVKRLLEKGASCDFSDSEYPMPLHFAAEEAFPEAVEYLVSEVPDINAVSGQSGTALNAAVAGAYSNPESGIRCVEILISNNADVNRYGGTLHSPLQSAAWYEVEELVRLFLDHGAEVDATGGCFTTALNAAVQSDHLDLTRMLLDAGASPAIELEDGNTILSSAIARLDSVESVELVEALLSPRGMALSGEALGKGLQVAARDDKLPFFQLLLREGGLVRSKGLGLPPILFSALSSWGESVLNYLLGEGRSCIDVDETDVHGTTGLAYAVAGDHYYVDELLDAGANPNIADRTGNTPLILAVKAGNETFVESLLRPDRATRIDLFDFAGRGALYWACYSRNEDVFDAIMKRLGQESAADHSLALHAAAARRADSMLDLLLVSGADPACLDRNNWSVYETAHEYMATEMIERLPVVELRSRRDGLKRPTSWNRLETHTQVDVSDDGLTITLKSFLGPDDAANARSDFCMPNDVAVYYFEVTIEKLVLQDGETNAKVAVGFCEEHVSLDRMVGWDRGSWGYHADDGLLRIGNRTSDDIKYGAYGEGTTIGCGVDFRDHTAFFTKNGELLGNGCLDVRGKLYPAVSFGHNIAAGSSMFVNFGGNPEVKLKYDLPGHLLSSSSSNMPPKPEPTSTRDKRRTRTKRRLKRTGSIPAAT